MSTDDGRMPGYKGLAIPDQWMSLKGHLSLVLSVGLVEASRGLPHGCIATPQGHRMIPESASGKQNLL